MVSVQFVEEEEGNFQTQGFDQGNGEEGVGVVENHQILDSNQRIGEEEVEGSRMVVPRRQ